MGSACVVQYPEIVSDRIWEFLYDKLLMMLKSCFYIEGSVECTKRFRCVCTERFGCVMCVTISGRLCVTISVWFCVTIRCACTERNWLDCA